MIKKRDNQLIVQIGKLQVAFTWGQKNLSTLWSEGIWVTGKGIKIPVEEMDDSHLVNAASLVARQVWAEAQQTDWVLGCHQPRGKMAKELTPVGTRVTIAVVLLWRHPIWSHFDNELHHRGLDDQVRKPWRM